MILGILLPVVALIVVGIVAPSAILSGICFFGAGCYFVGGIRGAADKMLREVNQGEDNDNRDPDTEV